MRVLVVGGAGYIGSEVTRALWERGYDVTVFDLLLYGGESLLWLRDRPLFRLVRGDIRDEAALAQIVPGHDTVCLLAAIVGEPACNRDPETAVATNLRGAQNVLRAARRAGVRRFVFASTCSNYGVADPNGLVSEQSPLQPLSTYAQTKVAAEQEILSAVNGEFHPTVLRLSTAFGVSGRMRFDLLVSDFTLAAVREGKITVYGEQFWRPFVHVADVAAAAQAVLEAEPALVSGEVFNVGANGNNLRKIDLARAVQRQVPGTVLKTVPAGNDPRSYRVDFSKVTARLGFCARWSVADGVRELYAALQAGVWCDPLEERYFN